MANTYSQIYIQIVFAVNGRENLIQSHNREELQKYIFGIIRKREQKLISIFCMPDHVHILLSLSPSVNLSDLVRDIKAISSHFINEKHWIKGKFSWQTGYGAFSYSKSQMNNVVQYIINQEKHHNQKSFKEEFLEFLKLYDIDYNEKYLFEFY